VKKALEVLRKATLIVEQSSLEAVRARAAFWSREDQKAYYIGKNLHKDGYHMTDATPLPEVLVETWKDGQKVLTCGMTEDCLSDVTHIDNRGFLYCTFHGLKRRNDTPCRKLWSHELNKLRKGEIIKGY
jgi:hypothetical protein